MKFFHISLLSNEEVHARKTKVEGNRKKEILETKRNVRRTLIAFVLCVLLFLMVVAGFSISWWSYFYQERTARAFWEGVLGVSASIIFLIALTSFIRAVFKRWEKLSSKLNCLTSCQTPIQWGKREIVFKEGNFASPGIFGAFNLSRRTRRGLSNLIHLTPGAKTFIENLGSNCFLIVSRDDEEYYIASW
ncbi:MAG: hypothetical protein AAB587_00845 [Patescibacteria group bacterium]